VYAEKEERSAVVLGNGKSYRLLFYDLNYQINKISILKPFLFLFQILQKFRTKWNIPFEEKKYKKTINFLNFELLYSL
jgi:hypothetical protein